MLLRCCTLMLFSLATIAQERQAGQGVNFYSYDKEAELGAKLAGDFKAQVSILESAAFSAYIARLGPQLAAQLPIYHFNYTFALVADDGLRGNAVHEPAWFPGGYIFVPASLVLTTDNEEEFAGMLAHSMAHIAERHGTRMATRGQLANMAAVPLIYIGGWQGFSGGDEMAPLGFRQVMRSYELAADALAVRMMAGAGYHPAALSRYINRVQKDKSNHAMNVSALPDRQQRLSGLDAAIAKLPARDYATSSTGEFLKMQQEVRGMVAERAPRPPSLQNRR